MNELSKRDYLFLEGTPFDRGVKHGESLKKEISEVTNQWKASLEKTYKTSPDDYINKFLSKTDFITAIEKYTPGLLDEVKGISQGSGIDFNTIFAFQLLDEFILNAEDISSEHCSTIGVNKINEKPAYLAQNWDIAGSMDGFQALLHIKNEETGIESFIFSIVGFVGAFGMNNKGIGVCVNSINQLKYSKEGLPVAFVIRGILEQSNQADAVEFLQKAKHASPQNYLIGGPEKIYDFECSANKVTPFIINESSEVVYHTNHALINDDYNTKHLDSLKEQDEEDIKNDNSHTRFNTLGNRLSVPPENISFDTIVSALSSHDSKEHSVCMDLRDDTLPFSFGSTVMVLSDNPEFHIAFGPPDVTEHRVYKFQ